MDVSSSLPSGSRTISFQELQIAHEKGRRGRKNWEPRDFAVNEEEYEAKTKQRSCGYVGDDIYLCIYIKSFKQCVFPANHHNDFYFK